MVVSSVYYGRCVFYFVFPIFGIAIVVVFAVPVVAVVSVVVAVAVVVGGFVDGQRVLLVVPLVAIILSVAVLLSVSLVGRGGERQLDA